MSRECEKIKRGYLWVLAFWSTCALSMTGNIVENKSLFAMLYAEMKGNGAAGFVCILLLTYFYRRYWGCYLKYKKTIVHLLSALFAVFLVIGLSYSALGNWDFMFAGRKQFIIALFTWGGFLILLDFGITLLYGWLSKREGHLLSGVFSPVIEKHYFIFCFVIISLCWLPYWLVHLPGSVPYDGYRQINMYYGIEAISNHHPWVLTMVIGHLMDIGRHISDNMGIILVVGFFFFVEVLCYAKVCVFIKKWGAPKIVHVLTFLFFAVVPAFGAYAQCVMKDGVFSAFFALFMAEYVDVCLGYSHREQEMFTVKHVFALLILGIFVCLTRNNGIYMVLPAFVLLIFFLKNKKKWFAVALVLLISVSYWVVDKPLAALYHVESGSIKEVLSIPFQQTARYLTEYPEDITEEEKEAIQAILYYNGLTDKYIPERSDRVKDSFIQTSTREDLMNYFKAWFSMFMRHPNVYFEATLHGTFGYYDPFHNCDPLAPYQFYIQDEPIATGAFDIHYMVQADVREKLDDYALAWRRIPGLALLVNPAAYTWLLLLLMGWQIYRKRYRDLILMIIPLLNVGICIMSPVNGYLRYALPLMACMPVIIYWCLTCYLVDKKDIGVQK